MSSNAKRMNCHAVLGTAGGGKRRIRGRLVDLHVVLLVILVLLLLRAPQLARNIVAVGHTGRSASSQVRRWHFGCITHHNTLRYTLADIFLVMDKSESHKSPLLDYCLRLFSAVVACEKKTPESGRVRLMS